MKLALNALLLLSSTLSVLAGSQPQKAVIVSYPKDTPDSMLNSAKKAIVEAGGIITHEYHLIKAFAAKAPAEALHSVQVMGATNNVLIEEDQEMSINK